MNTKAQSTLEVAVLFIIVIAAFIAMFGYFKRSIQGQWRGQADSFSEGQYDPAASRTESLSEWTTFNTASTKASIGGTAAQTKIYTDASGLDVLKIEGWGGSKATASTVGPAPPGPSSLPPEGWRDTDAGKEYCDRSGKCYPKEWMEQAGVTINEVGIVISGPEVSISPQ